MSTEHALRFLEKASHDDEINKKLADAGDSIKAWTQIANDAGFQFSSEDLQSVTKSVVNKVLDTELSDEDLDDVAGGARLSGAQALNFSGLKLNVGRLSRLSGFKVLALW